MEVDTLKNNQISKLLFKCFVVTDNFINNTEPNFFNKKVDLKPKFLRENLTLYYPNKQKIIILEVSQMSNRKFQTLFLRENLYLNS